MKKIITFAIALLLGTTMATAGNTPSIQETISNQLKVPAEILDTNYEKATIDFKMKPTGEVALVYVATENSALKKHITEHFNQIDFSNAQKLAEGNYSINVYFKML